MLQVNWRFSHLCLFNRSSRLLNMRQWKNAEFQQNHKILQSFSLTAQILKLENNLTSIERIWDAL